MGDEVEVVQVIKTRLLRHGKGVDASDPMRIVEQWWDMEGNLLWQLDTWSGEVYCPRGTSIQRSHVG